MIRPFTVLSMLLAGGTGLYLYQAKHSAQMLEREIGLRCDLFVEYVGGYRSHDHSSQIVDVGGGWHITPTQQLDFHIGAGLSQAAPHHYVGVGYSLRVDGLFARDAGRE